MNTPLRETGNQSQRSQAGSNPGRRAAGVSSMSPKLRSIDELMVSAVRSAPPGFIFAFGLL